MLKLRGDFALEINAASPLRFSQRRGSAGAGCAHARLPRDRESDTRQDRRALRLSSIRSVGPSGLKSPPVPTDLMVNYKTKSDALTAKFFNGFLIFAPVCDLPHTSWGFDADMLS